MSPVKALALWSTAAVTAANVATEPSLAHVRRLAQPRPERTPNLVSHRVGHRHARHAHLLTH